LKVEYINYLRSQFYGGNQINEDEMDM